MSWQEQLTSKLLVLKSLLYLSDNGNVVLHKQNNLLYSFFWLFSNARKRRRCFPYISFSMKPFLFSPLLQYRTILFKISCTQISFRIPKYRSEMIRIHSVTVSRMNNAHNVTYFRFIIPSYVVTEQSVFIFLMQQELQQFKSDLIVFLIIILRSIFCSLRRKS